MKFFLSLMLLGILNSCSHNPLGKRNIASSLFFNDSSFRKINLTNIKILNAEGGSTFPYNINAVEKISPQMMATLLKETGADLILSKIYTLANKRASSFKNVYVFVTQSSEGPNNTGFKLNIIYESNRDTSMTLVDYDITDASNKELKVVNGPSYELEKLRVLPETSFFN